MVIVEIFKKLHATDSSSSTRRVGALVGNDVLVTGTALGTTVTVIVGTMVGNDTVVVGDLTGDDAAGALTEQLVLPRALKQQVQTILAQSILIRSLDTEHNVDGMVPVNCELLNNHKLVSSVSPPNDDGTVPFNRLPRKLRVMSCVRFPNTDGIVPFN